MPNRLTQHQRKLRAKNDELEREISKITLQELQRLWRDFRIKLRRLDQQRPFTLQKAYDPEESRDPGGKWTSGGGGIAEAVKVKTHSIPESDVLEHTDKAVHHEKYSSNNFMISPEDEVYSCPSGHDDASKEILEHHGARPSVVAGNRATRAVDELGYIRIEAGYKDTDIETGAMDKATLRRLQRLVDAGKLALNDTIVWEGHGATQFDDRKHLSATREEFMSAKYVIVDPDKREATLKALSPGELRKSYPPLQKQYYLSRDLWEKFRERTHSRIKEKAKVILGVIAALYASHVLAVTGRTFMVDVDALMRDFEAELRMRLTRVTTTLQRVIATKVNAWYNNHEATLDDLVEKLEPQFGESKAKAVGRTEVALLAVAVLTAVAVATGVKTYWIETRRDELVCTQRLKGPDGATYRGCKALHGMVFDINTNKPPLHPLCRCKWHLIYTKENITHVIMP